MDPGAAARPLLAQAAASRSLAGAGDTLARAGGQVDEVNRHLENLRAQQQEKSDAVEAGVTLARARSEAQIELERAKETAPPGAPGFAESFLKTHQEKIAKINGAASPAVQQRLAPHLVELEGRIALEASSFEGNARAARRAADAEVSIDLTTNEVRSNPALLAQRLGETRQLLADAGLRGDHLVKLQRAAENGLALAAVSGMAASQPELALEQLNSGKFDALLDPRDKEGAIGAASAELARRAAKAEVERNRQIRSITGLSGDLMDRAKEGLIPGPEQMAALRGAAASTGDRALLAHVQEVEGRIQSRAIAVTMPPAKLAAAIVAMEADLHGRPDQVSGAEVRQLQDLKAVAVEMETGLKTNALGWASKVGLTPVKPLQLAIGGSPAEIQAQLPALLETVRERRSQAHAVASHYGVRPQFLTPEERGQWAQIFEEGSQDQKVMALNVIGAAFGEADGPLALSELKQAHPQAAYLAGLVAAGGDRRAAADALMGAQMLKRDPQLAPGGEDRLAAEADFRAALAGDPMRAADVAEAGLNIYVARQSRMGGADMQDEYEKSLQLAAGAVFADGVQYGGMTLVNGAPTLAPGGVRADQFEAIVQQMDDQDWLLGSVGGAAPRDRRGRTIGAGVPVWLVAIGDGHYNVSTADPSRGAPQWVRGSGQDGLYEFDWKQRLTALRAPGDAALQKTRAKDVVQP